MRRPAQIVCSFAAMAILVIGFTARGRAAEPQSSAPPPLLHHQLDQILDVNVRDGYVYYRALRADRARLDRYIAGLNVNAAEIAKWSREHQMAYWVNAYNAFVLQTVINNYPIRSRTSKFPANSIQQIPGAFDRLPHKAGGRSVTLDAIEKEVLAQFKEPRLYLALGRGAVGSGRLRSEAYTGDKIVKQLDDIQAEFVSEQTMLRIDKDAAAMWVTPILSWREAEFVAAYDTGASGPYAQRSPIERAIISFVMPHLLPMEKEFVRANTFRVSFRPFDWKLNDLTGGRR